MLVVGLTGGIATGKSTVSAMMRESGVPVICLDELSREVVQPGTEGLAEIRRVFGDSVVDPEGGLDRAAMASIVFNDSEKRALLESIIHPRVAQEKKRRIERYEDEGRRLVVVDIPLLFEVGWQDKCDVIVVVYSPKSIQEERLVQRDGISRKDARLRLDAQMSIEEKRNRADFVIDNSGTPEETREQVERTLRKMNSLGM